MSATLVAIEDHAVERVTERPTRMRPVPLVEVDAGPAYPDRLLSIYEPRDAYGLIDELIHLSERSIERNVFYDPRFLVPAMPRLEDRRVRLLVMRDEREDRSRLRLLLPYSLERLGGLRKRSVMRVWSHPFGPLGSLPLDGDDPVGTLKSLVHTLEARSLDLPETLIIPQVRIDGGMIQAVERCARELGLPIRIVNRYSRAALRKAGPPSLSLFDGLSGKRRRELRRGRRWLASFGAVSLEIAREPNAFRLALEDFLILEASGWKGHARSALTSDRYRAAFAREALNALAEKDRARIFTLRLDGEAIASIVLLVDGGDAYAWKTAYEERYAKAAPGQLIMAEATRALLADPTIRRADSCAVPDHFVMNRFWRDRTEIGTIVLGLKPGMEDAVASVARSLTKSNRTANRIRIVREAILSVFGR
ncbi:GNAT family N-acetyltransferase [Fulvimarina sp. 2208YS6-2-32]|uniref:GNAT family N-acetyltransferase n=1 Tax=Fulvimarina uroteuthidis TaxID=3098149 RepID=A0ABU5HZG8_9HYPH|nr:GNAT family N-acetyltransferase [Fulvimarina sp. 2208YS6-2-32]MDY8108356.1 GNAT family N-acetyltransferase [Fulvimarina sp. 2208YS6-2-32]